MDGDLRALPRKRRGTAALVMSKRLESQRRKDSVGGTWPHQRCGNAGNWKEKSSRPAIFQQPYSDDRAPRALRVGQAQRFDSEYLVRSFRAAGDEQNLIVIMFDDLIEC